MKRAASIILLFIVCCCTQVAASWPNEAYYRFQIGGSFGVSKIGAPLTDFPGSHWSIQGRYDQHTFGFRREWDGEFLKIWGEPLYYERLGIYYGWTEVKQYFQWGPQIGFGTIAYNHLRSGYGTSYTLEQGIYGDLAINALVNARGNGLGAKVFVNVNRFRVFAGITVFLQVGFSWNGKDESEPELFE